MGTRIVVSHHGRKRLKERMGKGCDSDVIARRCWERHEEPPDEWEAPKSLHRFTYLKYGDCVMVFARERDGHVLVTVVGPFGNGRKWESKKYLWQ